MLGDLLKRLLKSDRSVVEFAAFVGIALDFTLHPEIQIGPDRLRTGKAAPDAAEQGRRKKQTYGGDNQNPGDIINFLGPDDDVEKIPAPGRKVQQDHLIGNAFAPVPTEPRNDVIDAEQNPQGRPFERPEGPLNIARVNLRFVRIKTIGLGKAFLNRRQPVFGMGGVLSVLGIGVFFNMILASRPLAQRLP